MPAWLTDFVAVVVIPFIVQLLKKIKLPTKVAPYVAVILAAVYVGVAKALGLASTDFQTVLDFIIKALGIGGVAVLGYDVVKSIKG